MNTTSSMKVLVKALLTGALVAGATLGSGGCGPVVPVSPTWEHDVRPLMQARCVRCHDEPRPPAISPVPPFSLNYATYAEIPPALVTGILKMQLGPAIRGQKPFLRRMPPPPSAALEDWQIELLDNWIFNPQ